MSSDKKHFEHEISHLGLCRQIKSDFCLMLKLVINFNIKPTKYILEGCFYQDCSANSEFELNVKYVLNLK